VQPVDQLGDLRAHYGEDACPATGCEGVHGAAGNDDEVAGRDRPARASDQHLEISGEADEGFLAYVMDMGGA
jgi:hypothetical protein